MQVRKTQVQICRGGKHKYGNGKSDLSPDVTEKYHKTGLLLDPTHSTPYGTDGSSVGGRRHRLVTVLQPSYHPVCSSYQALSRSYLLPGLPILEHRQPARWSSSRLGSDSLWSVIANCFAQGRHRRSGLHSREPTESLRRILDTETQSTGNAAGASVAFADIESSMYKRRRRELPILLTDDYKKR